VFIGLVVVHDRVLAARDKVSRAVAWYEHGIARLEDRWCGIGARGDRFVDADHLFAEDLDLFGEASLFQLLSTAQTQAGEDTLASWLREPADRTEVTSRQAAVRDLLPRLELRERLATAGAEMRATVHLTTLSDWATAPPVLHATWPRVVALALSGLTVAWGTGTTTSLPMLLALFAMVAFAVSFRGHTRVMHAADGPARELAVLGGVCRVLREDVYASPRLSALRAALDTTAGEVHQVARRLERLVEFHDWQHNFMFPDRSRLSSSGSCTARSRSSPGGRDTAQPCRNGCGTSASSRRWRRSAPTPTSTRPMCIRSWSTSTDHRSTRPKRWRIH